MASPYPIFDRLINSFVLKKAQKSPLAKKVASLSANQESKKISTEIPSNAKKTQSSASKKTLTSPKQTAKEFVKVSTATESTQRTHIINNKFLDDFQKEKDTEIFIICLNRPFDLEVLASLHTISSYTIMADGAANRFHDKAQHLSYHNEIIPHALVGDFDSIRSDVFEYYKGKDVQTFHDKCQDDSDLEKCLRHLQNKFQDEILVNKTKFYKILITGALGGRLDHTLNNIHILHKFAEKFTDHENVSLHLMDNDSMGTCLLPGKTQYIRSKVFEQDAGCGIFPLMGEQAHVQTKGLKWNIGHGNHLSFKKFVSSSNEMTSEVIEFETDKIIFWTTTHKLHGKPSKE